MPLGLSRNAFIFTVTALSSLAFVTYFFLQKRKKSRAANDDSKYVLDANSISGLLGVFDIVDDPTLERLLVDVANLAAFKGNQDKIRECGGLPVVMDLVTSSSEQVRIKAARALGNLAMNDENQKEIQRCIPEVVDNLEPLDIGEEAAIAYLQLLINLAVTPTWHSEIRKGIPRTVALLESASSPAIVQKEALKLLVNLSDNPQNFSSLMEVNVLSSLQAFLKLDCEEGLTLRAMTCLSNIMHCKSILQKSTAADDTGLLGSEFPTAATIGTLCSQVKELQTHPNQNIADQANRALKYLLQ